MRPITLKIIACILLALFSATSNVEAADYVVEWRKTGTGGIVPMDFDYQPNPTRWHTVSNPLGINMRNPCSAPIKCIRIKVKTEGNRFVVIPPASNSVFPTIWVRKNPVPEFTTEVVFMDGDIRQGNQIWNQVRDRTRANFKTEDIFEGQIYRENYTITDPANWTQVLPAQPNNLVDQSDKWKELIQALPEGYDTVNCYSESGDGGRVYFTSRGAPFVYDFNSHDLRPIIINKVITGVINKIRVTDSKVELFSYGKIVDTIRLVEKNRFGDSMAKTK